MERMLDHYRLSGDGAYETFKEESASMQAMTHDLTAYGKDITFLSLCRIPKYQTPGYVTFYVLTPEGLRAFQEEGERIKIGRVPASEFGRELLDELTNTTGLVAVIDDIKYIVSDIAIPTVGLRASVNGDMVSERQNLFRDMHFADAIYAKDEKKNEKIHFVYREEELEGASAPVRKIFAALGGAFAPVGQTILSDVADFVEREGVMGKTEVRNWSVDHQFTDLYLEFPEVAEDIAATYGVPEGIVPGIFLCTSDIGKSSIIVRGTCRLKGSTKSVLTDEVTIKHVGKITAETVMERANEEVFAKLRVLPETLCSLMGESVCDYSDLDLSTSKGQQENSDIVGDLIETLAKTALADAGKANRTALVEALVAEINPEIPYTKYDIAVLFMGMPDRISGLDRFTEEKIARACAKVPFILKKDKGSAGKVVLLPA